MRVVEDSYFYTLEKARFLDLCSRFEAFSDYFTDTFGKRMLDKSYASIISKSTHPRDEAIQFFNQPVSDFIHRDVVYCEPEATIQQAARMMADHKCSSIFVKSGDGFTGVVTDNDLRNKVVATGLDIRGPVSDVMTTPLAMIPDNALVFEAILGMMQQNIKHLAVIDTQGNVIGVITNSDLLSAQGQSPIFLLREITAASRLEEVMDKHAKLPRVIQNLMNSGAKSRNVTRLITMISDAILDKVIRFTLEEMDPPPARFVFMIMGSEGRMEQTL